jgi:hypothetical protein
VKTENNILNFIASRWAITTISPGIASLEITAFITMLMIGLAKMHRSVQGG